MSFILRILMQDLSVRSSSTLLSMSLPLELSVDDIFKIWDKISNYIHKDKNAICLGMYLLNAQILYWYEDINKRFARWIVKKKIEPSELMEIVECAQSISKTSLVNIIDLQRLARDDEAESDKFLDSSVTCYSKTSYR
jgi:hypothetical protein